ncbi:Smg-4/UPF3 family-domain-containing protein [Aspergillus taichungensis]|uniref:Smg-4/UPF3 family-domain-containing protein n=1 Tax=Aspergillus taichungensis TaxID=482145 RepID=A0A2J5HFM0_9EURO|nr:Smg-4/UPF3 family-domain-containing protein [Aspergillus taichungensis]
MAQNSGAKSPGGVLQISAAATQKNTPTAPRKAPKPAAPRLKLLVRRLPPGLTQTEFETVLGPEWKTGAGKVDWLQYKPGKVSKDPAKPSRPSRAYIHVTAADHTIPLSNKVRQSSFVDARNTSTDPVLIGPPSLEFAPYAKVPGSRVRKDARQGTIDQDPEFIAFLESLTQPITKPSVEPSDQPEDKKEGPTVTPLIQYIRDKKANKAKDGAGRSSKHGKSDKDSRAEKVQAKKLLQRSDKDGPSTGGDKSERKSKSDRATKDAVRTGNKQAALVAKQAGKSGSQSADSAQSTPTERKRERGNAAVAAKILQRDLGLAQGGGRRKGGRAAENDAAKNEPARSPSEAPKKEILTKSKAGGQNQRGRGSNNSSNNSTPQPSEQPEPNGAPNSNNNNTTPPPPTKPSRSSRGKQAAAPPPTAATQAFLKHANPSQGVTEPLLDTAFSPFGKIVRVEIDKKKGFGYVDFADPDALQRAIAASPVTVAQSQVVVLERKANPGGEKGRGKGRNEPQASGSGGGGGGGGLSRSHYTARPKGYLL